MRNNGMYRNPRLINIIEAIPCNKVTRFAVLIRQPYLFFVDLRDLFTHVFQGLYSLSSKASYRQISWSIEATRLHVAIDRMGLKFDMHLSSAADQLAILW